MDLSDSVLDHLRHVAALPDLAWARRVRRGFVTKQLRGVTSGERELREEMRRVWT